MEEEFKLDKEDLESATWKKLENYFIGQLSKLRKINDQPASHEDTNFVRGGILTLKELIKLNPEIEDI